MKCLQRLSQSVVDSWYTPAGKGFSWTRILTPLSVLFSLLAARRKQKYLDKDRWEPLVPVIVVGNIAIGGTGKTPVVAALVEELQARGFKPGIVSRGFGAKNTLYPQVVTARSNAADIGDEPVMLATQLGVPIVVDPNRVKAAQHLCDHFSCDLIIADDGLQHYNLKRHIEVLVMDGQRMLGNRLCLPAGPLREPPERMNTVDLVLVNGDPVSPLDNVSIFCKSFYLLSDSLRPVNAENETIAPVTGKVHAVAGIGNPERFFKSLETLGFEVIPHAFADHHAFTADDIEFGDSLPVLMTAKDAVKCQHFADQRQWYLPVTAQLPEGFMETIVSLLEARVETKEQGDCLTEDSSQAPGSRNKRYDG